MASALARCETRHICFVDGDLFGSTRNIPVTLRSALDQGEPDMVVAEFDWPAKRLWSVTAGIYNPLVGALFPEAVGHVGRTAFSGLRILRTDLAIGALPPGFGVETYLNIRSATQGWVTRVVDIGTYEGVVRKHPTWGPEIGAMILDTAQALGRLDPARRRAWDDWVAEVCLVLRDEPDADADPGDYTERLIAAIDHPLPPAQAGVS
jgi:glucosyl-3-phosphoglycerate synthase